MTFDGKAFGVEVVTAVKTHVAAVLGPVSARLDALEKRLDSLPAPKDGKDADPEAVVAIVREQIAADLAELRSVVDSIEPAPELPDIPAMVAEAVKAMPAPKDGKDGERGPAGEPGARGEPGKDGRDGLDVKEMFRGEGGKLVAVMSDGTTRDLGVFVGKDGAPGKDGRDGFSLEDFDASLMEDGRTVLLSFVQGERTFKVELGFPAMIYRGVFKEGQEYARGDTVTWGGSLWHCDAETTTVKPDGQEKHWTLAAKRGRDAKTPAKTEG